ncbi:MAG: Mur ligase family protein, partial [Chroococcidiopsis sp.]
MSNACVIGLGKSGVAAARLLKREGWQVILSDRSDSTSLRQQQQQLAAEGITVCLGHTPNLASNLEGTASPQLIVVSPGVPWDADILIRARELGIETIGEMELAWRYLNAVPWVGITGTNGKTTTTALVAAIFQTAGLNAPACGNIGYAVCDVALEFRSQGAGSREQGAESRGAEGQRGRGSNSSHQPLATSHSFTTHSLDWIIAEISSYQIESALSVAPRIGVWTTFTPDHLSRHKTLERYYDIKAHLVHQSQLQVINGDDAFLSQEKANDW